MRVCLDSIIFALQRAGGISTYWAEFCRYLSQEPGMEVRFRMPRPCISIAAARALPAGTRVTTDRIPAALAQYLPFRAERGWIHHSSYYRRPLSPRAIGVVTVYDFTYERFGAGRERAMHSWLKAGAVRRANGVICISEHTRRDLLAHYPDVDPSRVVVIPLGVASERFFPVPPREINRGLADAVLFVGQRAGYKRFALAVEAVSRVPGLRLAIVGSDLAADEIALLDRHLERRWAMLGRTASDEGLRRAYSSCFALIYPSSYEGFGLPVLEAMACGCPVVTNRLSSIPEAGGEAALYSADQTPEAYAEQLSGLTDPALRASCVHAGLARSEAFPWRRTFSSTIAFYRDLAVS
jgi:mannosyltransferase